MKQTFFSTVWYAKSSVREKFDVRAVGRRFCYRLHIFTLFNLYYLIQMKIIFLSIQNLPTLLQYTELGISLNLLIRNKFLNIFLKIQRGRGKSFFFNQNLNIYHPHK